MSPISIIEGQRGAPRKVHLFKRLVNTALGADAKYRERAKLTRLSPEHLKDMGVDPVNPVQFTK